MKKLMVLIDDKWEFVFCRNSRILEPITTKDKTKAIKASCHSMQYFRMNFGNHHFKYSD